MLRRSVGWYRQCLVATASYERAVLLAVGDDGVEQVVYAADELLRRAVVVLVTPDRCGRPARVEAGVAPPDFMPIGNDPAVAPAAKPRWRRTSPSMLDVEWSVESNCGTMPVNCSTYPVDHHLIRVRAGFWPLLVRAAGSRQARDQLSPFQLAPAADYWSSCSRLDHPDRCRASSLILIGAREPSTTICCSTGSLASAGGKQAKRTGESMGGQAQGIRAGRWRFPSCCLF